MGAVEKIMIAEEKVSGLQDQLRVVESVLEKAEQVAVTGEKAGRGLRRLVQVLLLISVVAIIVMIARKVMGDGCPFGNKAIEDVELTPDAPVVEVAEDSSADEETASDEDTDAS